MVATTPSICGHTKSGSSALRAFLCLLLMVLATNIAAGGDGCDRMSAATPYVTARATPTFQDGKVQTSDSDGLCHVLLALSELEVGLVLAAENPWQTRMSSVRTTQPSEPAVPPPR